MSIKAIIWDMDGVIVDTERFWSQVERSVFVPLGVPADENFEDATTGLRCQDLIKYWGARYSLNLEGITPDDVHKKIITAMVKYIEDESQLLPHVLQVMNYFYDLKIEQAIASSSSKILIQSVISKFDLIKYIKNFSSAEDEQHGKPAPDVYLTMAKRLKVNPAECAVIEDSINGTLAGSRAGMLVYSVPDFRRHRFDEVFARYNDIPNTRVLNKLIDVTEVFS